jgi:hypothetical protein
MYLEHCIFNPPAKTFKITVLFLKFRCLPFEGCLYTFIFVLQIEKDALINCKLLVALIITKFKEASVVCLYLLSCDDEAFIEQPILDEKQLLDVILGPEPVAGQARHLQQNVDVLEEEISVIDEKLGSRSI